MKTKKGTRMGKIPVIEKIWAMKKIWIKGRLRYTIIYSNVSRRIVKNDAVETVLVTDDAKCSIFLETLRAQFLGKIKVIDLSPEEIQVSSEFAGIKKPAKTPTKHY